MQTGLMGGFTYAQFVLLAVNDDGGDLLIHEDENHRQQCRRKGREKTPPRIIGERLHDPATMGRLRRLQ